MSQSSSLERVLGREGAEAEAVGDVRKGALPAHSAPPPPHLTALPSSEPSSRLANGDSVLTGPLCLASLTHQIPRTPWTTTPLPRALRELRGDCRTGLPEQAVIPGSRPQAPAGPLVLPRSHSPAPVPVPAQSPPTRKIKSPQFGLKTA